MAIRVSLLIVILFINHSCSNNKAGSDLRNELPTVDSVIRNEIKTAQKENQVIVDTIYKWIVDGYAITNEMLPNESNNPFLKIISGKVISVDKGWFTNDSTHQTIVIELATDYHRMKIFHFDNNVIIEDLINQIALFDSNMKLASDKQIQKDLNGFIKQAKKIDSSFFTTNKEFRLGDPKEKATLIYGKPDNISNIKDIEKMEWEFVGDQLDYSKADVKDKAIAKDSFGHKVTMYFKKGKLAGIIFFNDIP